MTKLEKFIQKARAIHGNKYDYSKVEYVDNRTSVCIICPIHGEFWQKPCQHINMKRGCRICGNENKEKNSLGLNEFLKRAIEIHGDKYDYSKVEYVNNTTKVCIICKKHGEFWQTPKTHMNGSGCKKCYDEVRGSDSKIGFDGFVKRAKKIHGDKYDYSKVNYINANTKVCIICPIHGEFWQNPIHHLKCNGCPKCTKEKQVNKQHKINKLTFLEQLEEKFGLKYDLSKVNFVNSRTKIEIVCPIHGSFFVLPFLFLKSGGCKKCMIEEKQKYKENIEQDKINQKKIKLLEKKNFFIAKSKEIHGDKYDYSKVEYVNAKTKVCIICPIHGEFWQNPKIHMNGSGCKKCSVEKAALKSKFSVEEFIEKAKSVHGNKYDYSKVEYVNNRTKVCIICPTHGEFWQTPSMHYNEKQGCPLCGTLSSKGEIEIYEFIKSILPNQEIVLREHSILYPKELDIYIPNKHIAIEYNGLRWHSEKFISDKKYHLNKTIECEKKGVTLIHIFEDEWINNKEIVKSKLFHILNVKNNLPKIYARKCEIKTIDKNIGNEFLMKNHIQGFSNSSIMLGCFYLKKLIGVMSFLKCKNNSNEWILNRFATDNNFCCCGVGGKMINFFMREYEFSKITTYADRRWTNNSENNLYTKIGFILDEVLPPNYYYISERESFKRRIHKFNCRKNILSKKYNIDSKLSEKEMTEKIGLYKIWDCGLYKYVLRK